MSRSLIFPLAVFSIILNVSVMEESIEMMIWPMDDEISSDDIIFGRHMIAQV